MRNPRPEAKINLSGRARRVSGLGSASNQYSHMSGRFYRANGNPLEKVAARCRELLTRQQIALGSPGTILVDLQTLIDFIGTAGIQTKSQVGNLPSQVLPELNARISDPIALPLHKRALLRDYPNLTGLFVLLRVMNLVRTHGKRLWVDPGSLAVWAGLSPAAKYFSLLDSWLLTASGEVAGKGYWEQADQYNSNLEFLVALPSGAWTEFDEWIHLSSGRGSISPWNVQLQTRFGLIQARPALRVVRPYALRMGNNCLLTPYADVDRVSPCLGAGKPFSFTRAALSTSRRAKSRFLSPSLHYH